MHRIVFLLIGCLFFLVCSIAQPRTSQGPQSKSKDEENPVLLEMIVNQKLLKLDSRLFSEDALIKNGKKVGVWPKELAEMQADARRLAKAAEKKLMSGGNTRAAYLEYQAGVSMYSRLASKLSRSELDQHPRTAYIYLNYAQLLYPTLGEREKAKALLLAANQILDNSEGWGYGNGINKLEGPISQNKITKGNNGKIVKKIIESPSMRYREYASNNFYRIQIPDNWLSYEAQSSRIFAPQGTYDNSQGKNHYTHGVEIGIMLTTSKELREASDKVVNWVLQGNSYLHPEAGYKNFSINNRSTIVRILSGQSPVTNQIEAVAVYTLMLEKGKLCYVINVAPLKEIAVYDAVFTTIMNSLKLGK
jgi:hypothetical protein